MESEAARERQDTLAEIGLRVGANVLRQRRRLRLPQEEVAWRASLHRNAVYKVEHGERLPRADTLLKLCAALETSADNLLIGMDWVPPHETERRGAFAFTGRLDLLRSERKGRG